MGFWATATNREDKQLSELQQVTLHTIDRTIARRPHQDGTTYARAHFCLVTRIRLRSFWSLPTLLGRYVWLKRSSAAVPGLVLSSLNMAGFRTVYIASLWVDADAISSFGRYCPEHALVVRQTWASGAETWSGLYEFVGRTPLSAQWDKEYPVP